MKQRKGISYTTQGIIAGFYINLDNPLKPHIEVLCQNINNYVLFLNCKRFIIQYPVLLVISLTLIVEERIVMISGVVVVIVAITRLCTIINPQYILASGYVQQNYFAKF